MIPNYVEQFTFIQPTEYNDLTIEYMETPQNPEHVFSAPTGFASSLEITPEPYPISIQSIVKLPCTWKPVYQIEFDQKSEYLPGDSIGLLTPNSDDNVERLCYLLGIKDIYCRIQRSGKQPFTYVGLLKSFLKHRYDMTSLPKKIHLLCLARSSPKLRQVEYLCSKEGQRDYMQLSLDYVTIPDIIEYFDCNPTVEELFRNCEFIKPRYYSLTNSQDSSYTILLGEIRKETATGKSVYGHTSKYINDLYKALQGYTEENPAIEDKQDIKKTSAANDTKIDQYQPDTSILSPIQSPLGDSSMSIEAVFRRNILYNNMNAECIICFCTGTGIAPFLSLYNNRRGNQRLILVYGYRNEEDDISRQYDLRCLVIRAMSSKKEYVMAHCAILEQYKDYCNVFVCGNIRMQRGMFMEIKKKYPSIITEKRLFFDNWQ